MRVVLVQPPVCAERAYPLGLASLIPLLQAAGHPVKGADLSILSVDEACHLVLGSTDHGKGEGSSVVGITVMTRALSMVRRFVEHIRRRPGGDRVSIVLGGPHPTLFPESSLRETGADAVVQGPGEHVMPRLVEALGAGRRDPMAGVTWSGTTALAAMREACSGSDLDALPFADRQVFPIRRYASAMRSVAVPYTVMVTSRGCRRSCPWCAGPRLHPDGFVGRSPGHVIEEMAFLFRDHGVRDIHFEDDDLLADRGRIEGICEGLIDRRWPVVWECPNGIAPERLDAGLLRLMARAGCRSITLSIEALHNHGAAFEIARMRNLVQEARACGIVTGGYFILGFPGESLADMLQTIGGSRRLGLDRANFSPLQRFAGSWYGTDGVDGETSSRRASRLAALAHLAFYVRPGPLWSLLDDVARNPAVLPALFRKMAETARSA